MLLPSAPQTKPLLAEDDEELQHGYETDRGVRDVKSEGERMSKVERQKAGYKRMTAYCVAESLKMKLLASFLKREHNVQPRVFDEAMYVVRVFIPDLSSSIHDALCNVQTYHYPLLPGYGPGINVRSSAPPVPSPTTEAEDLRGAASEAEPDEAAEDVAYFSAPAPSSELHEFVPSSPPATGAISEPETPNIPGATRRSPHPDPETFAEAVFFAYGVVVFSGLNEAQERGILEDLETAEIMQKALAEERWEIEECHYEVRGAIPSHRMKFNVLLVQTIHRISTNLQRFLQ